MWKRRGFSLENEMLNKYHFVDINKTVRLTDPLSLL